MNDDLPDIRGTSEIVPAIFTLGGTEGRGQSIQFEDKRWLVLHWVVPDHQQWMQPRRLVLLDHLDHEVQTSPEMLVLVHTPIPADAKPEAEPTETAKLTLVLDYPQTIFEAYQKH